MTPHLLIDGDIIVYQTLSSCLSEADWGDGIVSVWVSLDEVDYTIDRIIGNYMDKLGAEDYTIALSCYDDPFRKRLDTTYKENRDGSKRPVGYKSALERLEAKHNCMRLRSLEADDVLGIMATRSNRRTIIVSDDKDLRQIPGELYVPRTAEHIRITPEDGFRYHMLQTLTGDRVDNYPGCPGIGDVRAARIVERDGDTWSNVVEAYNKAKLTEEDALLQARLAKILTVKEWDSDKQEVILWKPSSSAVSIAATRSSSRAARTTSSPSALTCTPTQNVEGPLKHRTSLRSR